MKRFLGVLCALVLVLSLAAITLPSPVLAILPSEVWVDDDNCPGPGSGTQLDPFCKIQDGIDAVASPGTVHVASGNYSENITLKSYAIVQGAGANVTTIDGSTARAGLPAYHVVIGADNATLDGFTVTGGSANGTGNNGIGGGLYNWYSSPTVTNCTFLSNSAWDGGGGMYNGESSPTVTNCTFSNNSAGWGGGMYNGESSPTVTKCTFSSNSASNGGGGMYNHDYSSSTVTNCLFHSNNSTMGWGGGMQNHKSSPMITNCTFSNNSGGGMLDWDSSPMVTNCIFWDNGYEIGNDATSTPSVTYSDVKGGYSGATNIDDNPLFVDPPGDDYHLQSGSPCIDKGTDTGAPTEDIEGNPRPIDGDAIPGAVTDMGAYEYVPLPPPPPSFTINISAYIDGRSMLIITKDTVQWHHLDWAAPGRLGFGNLPTIINGFDWYPQWADIPDAENRWCDCDSSTYEHLAPPLPESDMEVELLVIQARHLISIAQYPAAENDYTLILDFNDNPPGGADWYECDLGVTVSPPPPVEVGGTAYPVDKLTILAPWIVLVAALLVGTAVVVRRRRVRS